VFMDNVSVHKVDGVEEAIEARGAIPCYLPAYSPDLKSNRATICQAQSHAAQDCRIFLKHSAFTSTDWRAFGGGSSLGARQWHTEAARVSKTYWAGVSRRFSGHPVGRISRIWV